MEAESRGELRKFVAPEFVFGFGALDLAAQYALNLGASHVLVVSDPGVQRAGWTRRVTAGLDAAGLRCTSFDEVTPNPRDHEVMAGARVFAERRCDAIVVVGGGSPIDCAKGIGIVSSNGGHIRDYEGVDRVEVPCPPLVCVPTTAGTAADVSQFCIVSHTGDGYKMAIISKAVVPDVSLVDPVATTTKPRDLTAHTGLDTLTHAAEALVSNASSPFTEVHALAAVELVCAHLEGALTAGEDLGHRRGMALACLQAGLAFSNASLGIVHAMAHSLGGLQDLPHGECNAILLPLAIEYNYEAASAAYDRMGAVMGLEAGGLPPAERRDRLVAAVRRLQRLGEAEVPLGRLGVARADVRPLAERAMSDACIVTNPRRPTLDEVEQLYVRAL